MPSPLRPVKNSHKKMAAEHGVLYILHVSWPPLSEVSESTTEHQLVTMKYSNANMFNLEVVGLSDLQILEKTPV